MSRSITRATFIISIPLLTLAIIAVVGSQRAHSVVASRIGRVATVNVAFLQPRHAGEVRLMRVGRRAPAVIAARVEPIVDRLADLAAADQILQRAVPRLPAPVRLTWLLLLG